MEKYDKSNGNGKDSDFLCYTVKGRKLNASILCINVIGKCFDVKGKWFEEVMDC